MEVRVPSVTFKVRQQSDQAPGFVWADVTTQSMFAGKRVVVFSLPGAFTPTCSSTHLPGYEANYADVIAQGIDEVYCLSVNDSFVMNAWFRQQEITNVKPIPDGSGEFSRKFGMLVDKDNLGFGMRSWRYAMVVNDGVVEEMFVEPGYADNAGDDPFEVSDVYTMLRYLKAVS
jgi:peroxiredoxin